MEIICMFHGVVNVSVRLETSLPVIYAGDFFTDDLPPADLYVLARIIHDWPEEKCLTLLKRIYDTCRPGLCRALPQHVHATPV